MKGCRPITREEITRLKAHLSVRDTVLMYTLLTFGLRISEAIGLTFSDMAGEVFSVRSKKGSDNVSFPIPGWYRECVAALADHYTRDGIEITGDSFIFRSQKAGHVTREFAAQTFKKACLAAGIEGKIGTHGFRKAFVTRIYQETKFDLVATKKYSRHKSLSNLDYYVGTCDGTGLVAGLEW